MCNVPSAPPPPPPPPVLVLSSPTNSPTSDGQILFDSEICVWACENPSLREACARNNLCLHNTPFLYKYKHFESIMQQGPTCGIVALSMLVQGKVDPDEILSIAKSEGYTQNGEMFSCKYLARVAEKVLNVQSKIRCSVRNDDLFSNKTVRSLLDGAVLLVPYDADHNHTPCLRRGHTAHWALICGVIISEQCETFVSKPDNVYVFSRHGKSSHLAAWHLDKLDKSNKNLWEFSPKKAADGKVYVFPEGGMGGENGLRNQFLMFEGL